MLNENTTTTTATALDTRNTISSAIVPMQPASLDIWDKKYCLKTKHGHVLDADIDATYRRVAKRIASVESPDKQEAYYMQFLWTLRNGAIPAGRITSNAGAEEHKPARRTSTLLVAFVAEALVTIGLFARCVRLLFRCFAFWLRQVAADDAAVCHDHGGIKIAIERSEDER